MNTWSSLRFGCRAIKTSLPRTCSILSRQIVLEDKCVSLSNVNVRNFATEEKYVVKSPYADVPFPDINLSEFVWSMVDKIPDKTALICAQTGRQYTYAQAHGIVQRFAASLLKAGYKCGDVLAVVIPNTPEFPLVLFGAVEVGIVVTTVNPTFTPDEIAKQLRDSGAKCIVTIPETYGNVSKAASIVGNERKCKIPIIVSPGLTDSTIPSDAISFQEMTEKNIDTSVLSNCERPSPNDVVVLPYSSGTTGLPKGVMLSHKHLVTNCLQVISEPRLCVVERASNDFQEHIPALLPFYHIYGLVSLAIASLHMGCKVIAVPKFEPVHFVTTIVKQKASLLYLVPPLVQFMGSHPDVKGSYFDSVKAVNNGAAPVGPNDVDRLLKKAKHIKFMQGYGLTETSPVATILEHGCTKYTSSGKPIPNTEMKIINADTNENLGPGENGEVCIRGPQVMLGYHNNPKATAETIDPSGWLHTGDMGYYDEDNDFYIVDRYKELIKVKGLQVAPAELEDILRSHPDVADAAVIGIPDGRSGEVPRAFIVSKGSKLSEDEVKKFIAGKVAEHKHLNGGVEFVDTIPKNLSGKILRRKLKESYCK